MKRISLPFTSLWYLSIFVLLGLVALCGGPSSAWADTTTSNSTKDALSTSVNVSNVAGTWEKWPSGWYYKKKDGTYATGLFSPKGDSHWYYCNSKGLMKTGWIKTGGKWYYAQSSGAMASDWIWLNGYWYYLDPKTDGHPALTGFFNDGKTKYFANNDCQMKTGWIKVDGKWYYADSSGALKKGWVDYKGSKYYLDPQDKWHVMKTGVFKVNGNEYYATSAGKLVTDKWIKIKGTYKYADAKGILKTISGITVKNGAFYAYDAKGNPREGWIKCDGYHFYADPGKKGQLATGWRYIKNYWYYFGDAAVMATGWRSWNDGWYYLSPNNGRMYANGWKKIGGAEYKFTSSGKRVGAWVNVPCYYQNPELPTGCESVALTNALRFYGFNIAKTTIADSYLPRSGSNFVTAFMGNPYSESGGQTCAPGITNAANKYLRAQGSSLRAHEITGTSFAKLCTQHLDSGRPVIIWASIGYSYAGSVYASQSYNGRTYNAFSLSHTMVLCGYDDERGVVYLSDSISGKVTMPYSQVKSLYIKHGSQSVVIY